MKAIGYAAKGAAASAIFLQSDRGNARIGEPLIQPSEIRSANGVLRTTLTAAPGSVQLGDFSFPGFLYNDAYVPPVLRARLGDTLQIRLRNNLPSNPSNLHFHGMSVSPQGHSDNVFVEVHAGQQFDYEVRIPSNGRQSPGFFWYHPHAHGFVDEQIQGGMSGALIVDGIEQIFPILRRLPERFFLIKHAERKDGSEIISVNGQINPVVQTHPGEMQFWRIGHIGATLFIKFQIAGMPLFVVARDGHALSKPQKVSEFFIGPGERIDAIAIGPTRGQYSMRTIPFQNQAWRKPDPSQQIATIVSSDSGVPPRTSESEVLRQKIQGPMWIDEVRVARIARRRILKYSRTPDRRIL